MKFLRENWQLIGQLVLCIVVIVAVVVYAIWWVSYCHEYWFQSAIQVPQICLLRR